MSKISLLTFLQDKNSQNSPLNIKFQESLFPLEVTEQPVQMEVTTSSSNLDEDEEGTNFDEMSRIIQVGIFTNKHLLKMNRLLRSFELPASWESSS